MPRRDRAALVRTLAVAALACAGAPSFALAQSASYKAIVEQYRRGEYEQAIQKLNALPVREIEASARATRAAFRSRAGSDRPAVRRDFVEAALLLHTHASALWDLRQYNGAVITLLLDALEDSLPGRNPIDDGQPAAPDYTFLRCWYLFEVSYNQGHGRLRRARDLLRDAPPLVAEHPDMALAAGALHEIGWTLSREDADVGFSPDLREAERWYRRALAVVPTFDEARVRLGRVLTLAGEPDQAAGVLAAVRPEAEPAYRYLAQLFQGDVHQQRGEVLQARHAYEQAIAIQPRAQAARLALALLDHSSGARREAAIQVREATPRDAPEVADPWLWYGKGMAWRTEGYLAAMQKLVKP